MWRLLAVVTVLFVTPIASSAQSIEGVWKMVERETRGGANARIESGPQIQPSYLIYTDGYFMWSFLTGTEPRPFLGQSPTDAELIAVWQQYNTAAGTYELKDRTLTYTRLVTLDPALMLPVNQPLLRQLIVLTSDRLETSFTDADGVTTILKYTRVE